MSDEAQYEGIAIIGMAGRFPGAENVEEFWSNLVAGRESISFFNDAELAASGLDGPALRGRGQYVPARGVMNDADCFDAAFFGVNPKEAEVMDPQQRVFLEACWEALERAGYAPNKMSGSVSIFAGASTNTYVPYALEPRPELMELVGADLITYGNDKDYLTPRVAYKLGLKGPALNVSTACSTSLVAVGQACQSLLTYQCDVALAGGVSVRVPQQRGYYYDEGNIGSPDGHTRTFDARGEGTVFSNGVGVVVLKRLEDAIKDGDQIFAVIKGVGLNNDGSQRVSFGAPGVEGQSEAVAMAHALAGVDAATISYVEAHGTATPLGDPIEMAGLTKAFRMSTAAKQFCAIGSVKTNVGHLDVAAGAAGLIKTALALHHKIIPANLHFSKPNPKLDIESTPFYVNAALQQWKSNENTPRRAGISSFGTGGTNAHLVVEEAPQVEPSSDSRPWQLLILSAKTPEALERATTNLAGHLKQLAAGQQGPDALRALADAAFTLQTGRSEFVHRRAMACADPAEGAAALEAKDPKRIFTQHQKLNDPPVVFMFPGQGAQYAGMGAELYRTEKTFRAEVDRCAELLKPVLQADIRTVMFPEAGAEKDAEKLLVQTRFTQPALFVIEYALAKLWMSWGIHPAAMIGHSVGEYVAGCLAGAFTVEDALTLIAKRAELVQAQPGGTMLAVRLPEAEVVTLLQAHADARLAIAAINSPNLCVVSGPYDAIEAFENELSSKKIAARRLNTSHAFHSPMMEPVLAPFTELLRKVKFGEPKIPYVSNVTSRWITAEEATSPEYWAGHVRQTVRFADGVAELMKDAKYVLLEVGPGQTLTTLARQHPAKSAEQIVLASLPLAGEQEPRGLLDALGRLWIAGETVNWQQFYAGERRLRVVLPTYPFERKRHWPDSPIAARNTKQVAQVSAPVTGNDIQVSTRSEAPVAAVQVASASEQAVPEMQTDVPRKERLLAASRALMAELSGYDLSEVDPAASLLELGLDSLLLTQAAQVFHKKFGVSISFRQLMEELSSLEAIAEHLDTTLAPDAFAAPAKPVSAVAPGLQGASSVANLGAANVPSSVLEQILQQQQQLTQQVLQLMGRAPAPAPLPQSGASTATPSAATFAQSVPMVIKSEAKSHGPFKPLDRAANLATTPEQTAALEALIARYTKRTAESKKLAIKNRPLLADPRSASGFKQLWKEMIYPFFTTRSDGSRVWDVDGNEYVDFVMGFGASMFGHRPKFVVDAVKEQLDLGFEIGPIQPLAGEVAELVREFTGMQRVAFTNTGSEAVLAATRVARTVSGRDLIAVFAGSYHGIFDEVLFRPLTVNGETRTAASAPGIPASALAQVIVLDYGNPESLEIIRQRGAEIAAVLVEPVQSRRLDLQPREFMHQLRTVTKEIGSALIFDEVVTGFRVHPGGAQAYFGVRADLATYGKVIGGGISVGVVTGDAKYMDALDGGQWNYGDTSFPEVGVTFFAGTFVRHPLALAAAKAVLLHMKEKGPSLQVNLTARTAELAEQLREIINEFQAPYVLTQFMSMMQVNYPSEQKFAGLLFYLLRERGIHIWENRAFVITTAHSEADFTQLLTAFRECLQEMVQVGFLPPTPGSVSRTSGSGTDSSTKTSIEASPALAVLAAPTGVDQFPLTEAQKEIWLAAQMGGEAALGYNESLKLEFRGAFDVEMFRAAVQRVIQRHPILLASFSPDGQWQRVDPRRELQIPVIDLAAHKNPEQELERVMGREVTDSFDFAVGPLVRVCIVRLSAEHHVAVWTAHHIICDGWSGGLLVHELSAIYSALKQGTEPVLDVPVPFREYALATQPDTPEAAKAMAYWRQQFADVPAPLDLPTDHSRPLVRSARAATVKRTFDGKLQQSLKRVAGQQRTTLVVLLMAGLEALLHRLSGQTDFVIGLGVAGQAMTGKSCLVGHCVNLLPIRTTVQPDATFQENLAAVKKLVLDAYDHYQATTGGILQNVAVPRNPGRPPLVEVIFNVDRDVANAQFYGTEFSCERNPKRALHFDLFFNFVEGPRGLYVECDYNTDLFDAETLERWLLHYQTLLVGIAGNPAETFGKLPILTDTEQQELTSKWNTAVEFPKQRTLHGWFEQQSAKTPVAHAVTFERKQYTYAELNRRSNQIAHHLRALGVKPGTLVGLFVERSFEMVVGILGILKAGGAYLPIDPVYPKDRLSFMLEDADAPILLTQTSLAAELPEHQMKVVYFDKDHLEIDRHPETNPTNTTTPDDLAYVIYTSGSTGKPKGTRVTHYNVVRLMQATEKWYGFNEKDVWTFFHSHAFDFSVWELWGALLYGGRVVMVPYLTSRSPEEFYELMMSEGVTVLNQTPSAFKQLMQAEARLGAGQKTALRYVIFGGEALEMQSLAPWFARHGDQQPQLVNMYGITETTVHVTYRPISAADLKSGSVIGVPIPDLQVYLLDRLQQPVPVGVIGEIYVGGAGVAAGYLKREELTRQKFLPDTFSNKPGATLYRTGDLARYLPSRDIEYFGRIDHQVKIRGFRIELGEIEAVLGKYPAVKQCVVAAREDAPGDKILVAYYETQNGAAPDSSELRAHLKKEIPDYMVPSMFVRMDKLPLTPNGKIDLKALPAPDERAIEAKGTFLAPTDSIEQVLSQLWAKVLKVRRVGLNDNFFELGGHSLLAVRIIVEIEKIYNRRLPLATLLQAPTVGALAEVLRKESWTPSWSSLVPLQPGGSKPPLFLIHSHGGNVLEYHPLASHMGKDQPVYALQARGLDGNIVKNETLEQIASAYLSEIRSLQPAGPYVLAGFCFGGLVAMEAAQQLRAAGEKVELVVMIQTTRPGAPAFAADSSSAHRWWQRTAKRIDLESQNLAHRGPGYLAERLRRAWDVLRARTQIAADSRASNGDAQKNRSSMAYNLEVLGMEHDRAFDNYVPRPYHGNVLLFRASKQLPGMLSDLSLGWKPLVQGKLEIVEIVGHQQNILTEPRVARLAAELAKRLHPDVAEPPVTRDETAEAIPVLTA